MQLCASAAASNTELPHLRVVSDGVRELWRGTGPTVIRLSIGVGIQFFVLDSLKDMFYSRHAPSASGGESCSHRPEQPEPPELRLFAKGVSFRNHKCYLSGCLRLSMSLMVLVSRRILADYRCMAARYWCSRRRDAGWVCKAAAEAMGGVRGGGCSTSGCGGCHLPHHHRQNTHGDDWRQRALRGARSQPSSFTHHTIARYHLYHRTV